ncbi:MAG: calcium-binding protein [Salinarimonadaceae bacterium]|nr:MAG: calcium-binding protein [Salinarimonadaceae bacterium]
MQESLDLTTLIFLALAAFVIWRLRSVLGQKTGHEQPPQDVFGRQSPQSARDAGEDNVVRLPTSAEPPTGPDRWKGVAEPDSPVAKALDEIVRVEPDFDPHVFLEGSKVAYEMIVTAFAAGDRKTLKDLLAKDVYEGFEQAIADRESRGETAETTFVAIGKADIIAADVRNRVAQITVKIVSELITVTRDGAGTVVDGSPDTVVDVTDAWTFARTLGSRDPTWHLVATDAGQ